MRRLLLPPLLLALVSASATPAAASEPAGKGADREVRVSTVGLPIVWGGRLVNYVFVATVLKVAPGRDAEAVRAREPYFRDALVRAGHRTSFADPHDLTRVDERVVDAVLLREAGRIAGPGVIAAVEVAAQAPRQRNGLPRLGPSLPPRPPIP